MQVRVLSPPPFLFKKSFFHWELEFPEIVGTVDKFQGSACFHSFKMVDLERTAANVTREMIRVVLNRLKKDNKIYCEGYGAAAVWIKGLKKR